MNNIRQIQELNKKELENGVTPEASWHADYRDTAYVYIGGLPFELSEGDIVTIFSQYGEPTYINLVRDKETGKSRGFAFLKYEDQRSTDLAVDNLGGTVVMGRTLRVDHTRYKKKDDEAETGIDLTRDLEEIEETGEGRRKRRRTNESESEEERPMIQEEHELTKLIQEHEDEDPMKAYLIQEKKEEVALALAKVKGKKSEKAHKHRHRHNRSTREEGGREDEDARRSSGREDRHRRRSGSREHPSVKYLETRPRYRRRSESGGRHGDEHRSRRRESPRRTEREHDRTRDRRR
ncbi:uncharacterized protein LY89DRAFT_278917 [Mollisia scopiformis]|uniref:RRM domain-containing protein n=1 Tax=Mollisia scopiformis TaxID=149040 RepID=A0A132BCZ0_MOLSC|nr:uncharacterized protein LY89DRAFT_278917 [Mollisia scopiformis]KUJ09859.1 hypothetical protein LY89DRAFT_278917 [Mollisia scopiformis]